jgi:hypothetical protein
MAMPGKDLKSKAVKPDRKEIAARYTSPIPVAAAKPAKAKELTEKEVKIARIKSEREDSLKRRVQEKD